MHDCCYQCQDRLDLAQKQLFMMVFDCVLLTLRSAAMMQTGYQLVQHPAADNPLTESNSGALTDYERSVSATS